MEFRGHGMGDPDFLKDSAAIPHFAPFSPHFQEGFYSPFLKQFLGTPDGWEL